MLPHAGLFSVHILPVRKLRLHTATPDFAPATLPHTHTVFFPAQEKKN